MLFHDIRVVDNALAAIHMRGNTMSPRPEVQMSLVAGLNTTNGML